VLLKLNKSPLFIFKAFDLYLALSIRWWTKIALIVHVSGVWALLPVRDLGVFDIP
jgi:hypothetical protein